MISPPGGTIKPQRARDRHPLSCAARIRVHHLVEAGEPDGPSAWLLHEIAAAITECCAHTRLKSLRLAHGWTVERAVTEVGKLCDRLSMKRRGLTERSWREWETGAYPDRDGKFIVIVPTQPAPNASR